MKISKVCDSHNSRIKLSLCTHFWYNIHEFEINLDLPRDVGVVVSHEGSNGRGGRVKLRDAVLFNYFPVTTSIGIGRDTFILKSKAKTNALQKLLSNYELL